MFSQKLKFLTFLLLCITLLQRINSQSTTTKATTTTKSTTTSQALLANASSFNFTNCGDRCKNGQVYLILLPQITNNLQRIDILTTNNSQSSLNFSVESIDSLTLSFYITRSTFTTDNSFESSVQIKLKPMLVRTDSKTPIFLLVNKTSICYLFEKFCTTTCFEVPAIVNSNLDLFTIDSQTSIRSNVFMTSNKSVIYFASDKCKSEMFNDPDSSYLQSMKQQIASIYDLTLNTFKFFGFIGSDGYVKDPNWSKEVFLNDFCQRSWRNYKLKQIHYLNSSSFSLSSYDAVLIADEKVFQLRSTNTEFYLDVYDFKGFLLASNKLNIYFNFTDSIYVGFRKIFSLNNSQICIAISFYNYQYQYYNYRYDYFNILIKFSSLYPFSQLEVVSRKLLSSNDQWSSLLYNRQNDQIYMISSYSITIFDASLVNIGNMSRNGNDYLTSYSYKHNGKYFYYTDGNEIKKYDDVKVELGTRKVKNPNITFSEFVIVKDCVVAGFAKTYNYMYGTYSLSSYLIYIDGQEGYAPQVIGSVSGGSDFKSFSSPNGKIYLIDFSVYKIYELDFQ